MARITLHIGMPRTSSAIAAGLASGSDELVPTSMIAALATERDGTAHVRAHVPGTPMNSGAVTGSSDDHPASRPLLVEEDIVVDLAQHVLNVAPGTHSGGARDPYSLGGHH